MPRFVLLAATLALTACRGVTTSYDYPDDLSHPNYVKRSKAAREFATRGDEAQLPRAFDLLLDDEAHIRAIAFPAIREMSGGKDFGYRPYLASASRYGIVSRWRAWWNHRGSGENPSSAVPDAMSAPDATPVPEVEPVFDETPGEASGG